MTLLLIVATIGQCAGDSCSSSYLMPAPSYRRVASTPSVMIPIWDDKGVTYLTPAQARAKPLPALPAPIKSRLDRLESRVKKLEEIKFR